MDPTAIGDEVSTFLTQLSAWAAIALPNLISAIVLLAFGWWLADRAGRAVRVLVATRVEPTLSTIIATLVRYGILIVVIVAVLGQLGIQTTSILAALGAAGLAIGLAMQGTLSNIAAGLMLLWLRPFNVGDNIATETVTGVVKDVGLFACEVQSLEGVYQFVPNSELWNKRIVNYSRLPTRQITMRFGIGYADDPGKAREVLLNVAASDKRVRAEPKPTVFVEELSPRAVGLALQVWVATADYGDVQHDLTERGKIALAQAGLFMPVVEREIHVQAAKPAQA